MVRSSPPIILIRCDGSRAIGFGHVVRCIALADELRAVHDCRVVFLMRHGPEGVEMARAAGYSVLTPADEIEVQQAGWPESLIHRAQPDMVVFDIRDDFPRRAMDSLREQGTCVAVIDDISERCCSADLAFFPPVPQVERLDWSGFSGQRFVGWEWVLVRRDIQTLRNLPKPRGERVRVLVTMGGSDPYGFTCKALRACQRVRQDIALVVALGPGFADRQELEELVKRSHVPIDILSNVRDLPALMQESDFIVGAFGNTAYEAAALGRFGVYLCGTPDHAESASPYARAGFGVSLGLGSEVSEEQLARAIEQYASSSSMGGSDPRRGHRAAFDGLGATRIAEKLVQTIRERRGIQQAVAAP